jgi:outer membrane protein assembly factor BamD (BamD/ComL family)
MCCLSACARIKGYRDAEYADSLFNKKQYAEAIAEYDRIAREARGTNRGANALYFSASARVYYGNPDNDYVRSMQAFDEFLQIYPNDSRAEDARNWLHTIKLVVELKKENERLLKKIDQLKKIDIRHEERRRQ